MMKLYGFKQSRSFRVIWMFKELHQEFEYIQIEPRKDLFSDWFLAINPAGKVPVLVDGDIILTESAAILTYLGDEYPESELVPHWGSKLRSYYNQWCYFALTELEQPLWLIHKHRFIFPKSLRVPEIKTSALWEFDNQLDILAKGLADQEWILGEQFTAADILLGETLRWAKNYQIDFKSQEIEQYYQRLNNRPAFQEALTSE